MRYTVLEYVPLMNGQKTTQEAHSPYDAIRNIEMPQGGKEYVVIDENNKAWWYRGASGLLDRQQKSIKYV